MISMTLPGKGAMSIFSGPPKMDLPPPPPPAPTREDPEVLAAKKKLRESEARRKGRASTILAAKEDALGEAPVVRPEAGSATLG